MNGVSRLVRAWMAIGAAAYAAWPLGAIATPVAILVQEILQSVVVALAVRLIVDELQAGNVPRAALWTAILAITAVLSGASAAVVDKVQLVMEARCVQEITQRLMRALVAAPGLEHLEAPAYADRLRQARDRTRLPADLFLNLAAAAGSIVTIAVSLVLLGRIHPLLALVVLVAAPAGLLRGAAMTKELSYVRQSVASERLADRYRALATGVEGAKDIRLLALAQHLVERYRQLRSAVTAAHARGRLQHIKPAVIGGLAEGLCLSAGIAFLVSLVAGRQASGGDAALGIILLQSTLGNARNLLGKSSRLVEMAFLAGDILALLEYHSPVRDPALPLPCPRTLEHGMHVHNVDFTYPGGDRPVLRGLSVFFPAGQTVALVGENGSGKTTLLKLLCRFYDPDQGAITVDGCDLRAFTVDDWRSRLSIVLQDAVQYHFLLRETVGIGDVTQIGNDERIRGALQDAGAGTLPRQVPGGLETQLGAEYPGGANLSTGQWQKLALARGRMRQAPLLLMLDEPAASLDPAAEFEMVRRL